MSIRSLFIKWRYYGIGRDEYIKCKKNSFADNLYGLRKANSVVAVLSFSYTVFRYFFYRNDYITIAVHFGTGLVALLMLFIINFIIAKRNNGKQINNWIIYVLIIVYFLNVIFFGIYLGVWVNPGIPATSFLGILICALFLFDLSAVMNMCFTLGAMALFMILSIVKNDSPVWVLDLQNAVFAGSIGCYFGWQIVNTRMQRVSLTRKLEEERNSYYYQSTIDELTQLKNRRDFMETFKRVLTSHRQSDNFLCIAILDIDFFKKYNDYYGHPQGDECLRSIGKALNSIKNSLGIYAARIGGEEFALIWFEKKAANIHSVVLQINQSIRNLDIPHAGSGVAPYITISIGMHVAQCGDSNTIETLYNLADNALYTAKERGRNRAIISGNTATPVIEFS